MLIYFISSKNKNQCAVWIRVSSLQAPLNTANTPANGAAARRHDGVAALECWLQSAQDLSVRSTLTHGERDTVGCGAQGGRGGEDRALSSAFAYRAYPAASPHPPFRMRGYAASVDRGELGWPPRPRPRRAGVRLDQLTGEPGEAERMDSHLQHV